MIYYNKPLHCFSHDTTISFRFSLVFLFCAAVSKSRPASMDLLLLHSRRSQTDLRPSHGRQLPQIPTSPQRSGQGGEGETGGEGGGGGGGGGEARDHTYTEVGLRNNPTPTHYLDDGLYESVGVREGPKVPSAPPTTSANAPAIARAPQSPSTHASGARSGNGHANVRTCILNSCKYKATCSRAIMHSCTFLRKTSGEVHALSSLTAAISHVK